MKAVTVYKCGICGRVYEDVYGCEVCEKSHVKPIEIVSYNAEGSLFDYYPSYISIRFDNGAIKKYYWDKMMS